jgi:glycosyltransferase involved in cell wall biosynthesis
MNPQGGRFVLLVAFHYPPFATSSGVQRTLALSRHLRRLGWNPIVLTVKPGVYERAHPSQLADIPADVPVRRTLALDAARDLAIGGRYWSRLALPDRWTTWWLTAVPAGLRLIRRHRIDAIWSTYPIATAHAIGATLARWSGLPWIADFRDPMVECDKETGQSFPSDPALREARLRIEARAVEGAARLVFCTEGARQIVLNRYPSLAPARTAVIPNGFEEQAFSGLASRQHPCDRHRRLVLLHSGIIYVGPDRDPREVFRAIRLLADRGVVTAAQIEVRLRDPSNEAILRRLAAEIGVSEFVSIEPQLAYRDALQEMVMADGLLLLQGQPSNPAVPAKLYEYLRAGQPIIACVHGDGETAKTLASLGVDTIAPLTDANAIAALIERWVRNPGALAARLPSTQAIAAYSREALTGELARLLDATRTARHPNSDR